MWAGCLHMGSALLAPRLLWLPTAAPICFSAQGCKRKRRGHTLWHGACFALSAWVPRCSAAPYSAGVSTAHGMVRENRIVCVVIK